MKKITQYTYFMKKLLYLLCFISNIAFGQSIINSNQLPIIPISKVDTTSSTGVVSKTRLNNTLNIGQYYIPFGTATNNFSKVDALKYVPTPTIPVTGTFYWDGDSITAGFHSTVPNRKHTTLTSLALGYTENNQGYSGKKLHDTYTAGTSQIPNYVSANDKAAICLGINDIIGYADTTTYPSGQFRSEYTTVFNRYIAKGWSASQLYLENTTYSTAVTFPTHQTYFNLIIKHIADSAGAHYVDQFSVINNNGKGNLLTDGIHPGDLGHKLMSIQELSSIRAATNTNRLEVNSKVKFNTIQINQGNFIPGKYNANILGVDSVGNIGPLSELPDQTRFKGDVILSGKMIDSLAWQTVPSTAIAGDYILGPGNSITGVAVINTPTIYGKFIPQTSNGTMELRNYYTGTGGTIDFYTKGTQLAFSIDVNGNLNPQYETIAQVNKGFSNSYSSKYNAFIPTNSQGATVIQNSWNNQGILINTMPSSTELTTTKIWPSGSILTQPTVGVGSPVESITSAYTLESTTKGYLVPRMTTAQRDAIVKESVASVTGSGGTGYTVGSFIFNPNLSGSFGGTYTVSGGAITSMILTNGGYGFSSTPTVSIGSGGSGATFTVTMGWREGLMIYNTDTHHYNVVSNGVWVALDNATDGDAINTATDANYTITSSKQLIKLPVITAARTVIIPTASSYTGQKIIVLNQNTSGTNSWSFSGSVLDATGASITTLTNGVSYILESDGTNWNKIN